MKSRLNYSTKLIIMFLILLFVIVFSITIGRYPISIKQLCQIFFSKFSFIDSTWTLQQKTILYNIRLPRIFMACMVGSCLSTAGAAYQGVFKNPMAAPDILGASSGAALGAALAIILELGKIFIMLFAFIFSLIAVAIVLFINSRIKGKKVLGLILVGIMVSSLCTAGISYMKLIADPNDILPAITYWLMGSLAKTRPNDLLITIIPMSLGIIPLILLRWRINLLTLSEDEALSMGVNVKNIRIIVIICATLITASSVSISGLIGWIGLVIPHLSRRIVGNNYIYLLPATMLCGAIFLLIVDNVSRNAHPIEIPIGILTAVIGAPFFLWLITRDDNRL